jgi:hypothetical protein
MGNDFQKIMRIFLGVVMLAILGAFLSCERIEDDVLLDSMTSSSDLALSESALQKQSLNAISSQSVLINISLGSSVAAKWRDSIPAKPSFCQW